MMGNTKSYEIMKDIIKQYENTEKCNDNLRKISVEVEEVCTQYIQECFQMINVKQFQELQSVIRKGRIVNKHLRKVLETDEDTALFYFGMFAGIHNTVSHFAVNMLEENKIEEDVQHVLRKKYRCEILKYIYYNKVASPEDLRLYLCVEHKSQITKIMKELEDISYIIRRELGKYVRYELTEKSHFYIQEYLKKYQDVVDADEDWEIVDTWKISDNRLIDNLLSESNQKNIVMDLKIRTDYISNNDNTSGREEIMRFEYGKMKKKCEVL